MKDKKKLTKLLAAFLAVATALSCAAIGSIYAFEGTEKEAAETAAAVADTTVTEETTAPADTTTEDTTVPADTATEDTTAPADTAAPTITVVPDDTTVDTTTGLIGKDKALEIALNDAGRTADEVKKIKVKLDKENGIKVYEVEFDCENIEYEYEIDAATGKIIVNDRDIDDDKHDGKYNGKYHGENDMTIDETKLIGEDAAKSAALTHAGVDAAKAVFNKLKLDREDGKVIYEIKFTVDTVKYEYDIDAYTGDITEFESHDKKSNNGKFDKEEIKIDESKLETVKLIGEDAAKSAALAHAGVDVTTAKLDKIELDHDECGVVYEVEFISNGIEYEYDINAYTGEVLKAEKEKADD